MYMWECVYVLGVGIESQRETIHSTFFVFKKAFEYKVISVCLCDSHICVNSLLYVFLHFSPCLFVMADRTREPS